MVSKQKRKSGYTFWLVMGLLAFLLSTPQGMVTKILTSNGLDAFSFMAIRNGVILVCVLPVALVGTIRHWCAIKRHWRPMLVGGMCLGASSVAYTVAIETGMASHVSIINLLTPIVLVVLSAKIVHDKVSHRATVGITLAAVGGVLAVAVPMLLTGAVESFINPVSVFLALFNCIVYPIAMVYMRRANGEGVPLSLMLALSSVLVVLMSLVLEPTMRGTTILDALPGLSVFDWILVVIYSGIIVALLVRLVIVRSYEVVGATVLGGFEYLHTLLAIILPIIILNEKLSPEIFAGAILILLGIYLTESHHHMHPHTHILHAPIHKKAKSRR
ncbi:MAG: DMT family transporter [Candidatus Nomurabacteria bacterium]|nr:DMT family transporter [Candidatus Nomurabacteria bacterium]